MNDLRVSDSVVFTSVGHMMTQIDDFDSNLISRVASHATLHARSAVDSPARSLFTPDCKPHFYTRFLLQIARCMCTPHCSRAFHARCMLYLNARLPHQVSWRGATRCWPWADGPASGRTDGPASGRTDGCGAWSAAVHPSGIRVPSAILELTI